MSNQRFFFYTASKLIVRNDLDDKVEPDWSDNYEDEIIEVISLAGYDIDNLVEYKEEFDKVSTVFLKNTFVHVATFDSYEMPFLDAVSGDFIRLSDYCIDKISQSSEKADICEVGEEVEVIKRVFDIENNSVDYYLRKYVLDEWEEKNLSEFKDIMDADEIDDIDEEDDSAEYYSGNSTLYI